MTNLVNKGTVMSFNKILRLKSDPYGQMDRVKQENPDLNQYERQIILEQPLVVRLPSHVKPCAITVKVPVNHNPDFIMYRLWIEVKGHVFKHEWLKLLKELPHPELYKIVLCAKSKKDRDRLKRRLVHQCPRIEFCDYEQRAQHQQRWLRQAIEDWQQCTHEEKQATRALVKRMTGDVPTHYF